MTDSLVNLFGPLDGANIPGGCEDCDAFQRVRPLARRVLVLDIFHDDDCPTLAAMEAATLRRGDAGV